MSSLSYLYTSVNGAVPSQDLGALVAPSGGLLKVTTGAGGGTVSLATEGVDYLKQLTTSTGILIGTPIDGATPVNLPGSTPTTLVPAHGDLLVGNGSEYVPVAAAGSTFGEVLTITSVTPYTLGWRPGGGGGTPVNWSIYPAIQDVDMYGGSTPTYNAIRQASYVSFHINDAEFEPDINPALWVSSVDSVNLLSLGSPAAGTSNIVQGLYQDTNYALPGSILYGVGDGIYKSLPVGGAAGDVLTLVSGLETYIPAWVAPPPPPEPSPLAHGVNCVMWISAGYNGFADYTYNNGDAGVGATLTYNTNFALTPGYIDNYNGPTGVEGISSGLRILVVDKNNLNYSGIYLLTQVGSGSTPPILTRTLDFDTPALMTPGSPIYILPYTPYNDTGLGIPSSISTFGGQFVTFMTFETIVIGTTPLNFVSDVFSKPAYLTPSWTDFFRFDSTPEYPRALMPLGGRSFFSSSFSTYVNYIGPGTPVTRGVTFGRMDPSQSNFSAYTDTFAMNPANLANQTSLIIPTPNGNAATLYPGDYLAYQTDSQENTGGPFEWFVIFVGKWLE